jgi:group II intron reverse transcriptase/maturase
MDIDWLREAYRRTRKDGAVGVDGQTAAEYAENLEDNLQSLLDRAKSGTYRAPPVRRVHIPKGDGSQTRPLGIPTFEDKILQRAVVMLLEPIYEQDFYDLSYGFRPRRSPHDALEALREGLWEMRGGWVLDVDIRNYFGTIGRRELQDLVRQRVADGVVRRLIGKWLRAGVQEDGVVSHADAGTPQGGVISPLLSNIYLHDVLDKWWTEEVLPRLRGKAFMVRFADDFVMVFSDREDAERVHAVLPKRFERFGLAVHPEKTRLVQFRRPRRDGGGKGPGSFDFLGFTLFWGRSRRGAWVLKRKTAKNRVSRGLREINRWASRARHLPIEVQAAQLGSKLRGHFNYYGIRGNSGGISRFRYEARRLWKKWLGRRSQRADMTWDKFNRLLQRNPLPLARIKRAGKQLRLANL